MRIGELAARAGVSVRALRYYEEQDLLESTRSPSGQRHYPESAVERVRLIQQLYAAGLVSRAIVELLSCVHTGVAGPEVLARLSAERDRMDRQVCDLTTTRERLDGVIAAAAESAAGRPGVARLVTGSAAVRWGLLSTAAINDKLLAGARRAEGVEVVAVASRVEDRARAFAAEHGIARAHGSYEALLADPDVDAVYVPLPNGLHHEWTVRALEAGKHVLCEKPYSSHPHEVVEAFDLAAARGLVLSEAYMYRYHPQTRRLHELLRGGAIGDLRLISGSFTFLLDRPADVRLDPALDGGALLDVGCYPVSAARLLAGEPESVAAQQVIGPTGVDLATTALLRFPGGVLAHLDCGFEVPERSALEVVGTRGRIQVRDPWHGGSPGLVLERDGAAPEQVRIADADPYALELEAVGAAIAGDATAALGRDDALGQAAALAAIRESAERVTRAT